MMKRKLKLHTLRVQSFVTCGEKAEKIIGGQATLICVQTNHPVCATKEPVCLSSITQPCIPEQSLMANCPTNYHDCLRGTLGTLCYQQMTGKPLCI